MTSCPPPEIRSRQKGPQDPGNQQPPQSMEPRQPIAGTTTCPPRRQQRKSLDRAPMAIEQGPQRTRGDGPTYPPGTSYLSMTWVRDSEALKSDNHPAPQQTLCPTPKRNRPHQTTNQSRPAPAPVPLAEHPMDQNVATGGCSMSSGKIWRATPPQRENLQVGPRPPQPSAQQAQHLITTFTTTTYYTMAWVQDPPPQVHSSSPQ